MKMTIDEIIKYLPAPMCDSTVVSSEIQKEYEVHDTAVIIMRKYQKIEQIVDRPIGNNAEEKAYNYMMIVKDIKEVLEDGADTTNTGSN